MVKRLNIILKKSFRPNVEVVTDEKLPNRLTGPYRRQIHCPRLRKHKDYLNYSCKRQKKLSGGLGIANLRLSGENLVTSHWPSAGNGCN